MTLSRFALGYRDFCSEALVREQIKTSKHYREGSESPSQASTLLIFSTSKQRTWLIVTPWRLYVVLDDIRKAEPKLLRSTPKGRLFDESGAPKDVIRGHSRLSTYSDTIGGLEFEGYRNLLFSHKLFAESSIEDQVTSLLTEQMAGAAAPAPA